MLTIFNCGIFNNHWQPIQAINSVITIKKNEHLFYKTQKITKNILATPTGNAEQNRIKENRQFAHSQFIPTGLFATKGATITISIDYRTDFNLNDFSIFVGQWGVYRNLNNQQNLHPHQYKFQQWKQSIITEEEGMVYVGNESLNAEFIVNLEIDHAINIPTFQVNQTGNFDFAWQLQNWAEAPFVELIGQNIFATLQMSLMKKNIARKNPKDFIFNQIITYWDKVVELSNQVSGLNHKMNSQHFKFNNKVHIANPDNGYGYAYSTQNYIGFQLETGAGEDLINEKTFFDNWGLWHEIGHTYQNPDYLFDTFIETTVNINAFYIEEKLQLPNSYLTRIPDIKIMKHYLEDESKNKDLEKLNEWIKLGIFLQLHMAYGPHFFHYLNQNYRNLNNDQKPRDNYQKYQLFIVMCSKLVGKNLVPFFDKWGIYADALTEKTLSKFKPLTVPIWLNIITQEKVIDKYIN